MAGTDQDRLAIFETQADELIPRYDALDPKTVYGPVRDLLPPAPAWVADIGAGTGRDAAWFAGKGARVLAAEPVAAFRAYAQSAHASQRISWLDDRLPKLRVMRRQGRAVDLVVMIAVWHHLHADERPAAMAALRDLMAPRARLILSVKKRPGAETAHDAGITHTLALASEQGLTLKAKRAAPSVQPANQALGATWTWLVVDAPA